MRALFTAEKSSALPEKEAFHVSHRPWCLPVLAFLDVCGNVYVSLSDQPDAQYAFARAAALMN